MGSAGGPRLYEVPLALVGVLVWAAQRWYRSGFVWDGGQGTVAGDGGPFYAGGEMISRQRFRGRRLGSVYCPCYYCVYKYCVEVLYFLAACVPSVIMALLSVIPGFGAHLGRERVARLGQSAPGDQHRDFRAPPFSFFLRRRDGLRVGKWALTENDGVLRGGEFREVVLSRTGVERHF
jgi:hypothetical protein